MSVSEFAALARRLKDRENRAQIATARLAAAMCSSSERKVDYEDFLPFPPPPTFITVDSAEVLLLEWVKTAGGTVSKIAK